MPLEGGCQRSGRELFERQTTKPPGARINGTWRTDETRQVSRTKATLFALASNELSGAPRHSTSRPLILSQAASQVRRQLDTETMTEQFHVAKILLGRRISVSVAEHLGGRRQAAHACACD